MSVLSPEQRKILLAKTRTSALALLEDLAYLRRAIARDAPDPAEIRRMTVILRRLLVERDLAIVAAPRIGKLQLPSLDNSQLYKFNGNTIIGFFAGAELLAYKVKFDFILIGMDHHFPALLTRKPILLRLEGFLTQRVLCFNGHWVSRKGVIDYVAYKLSGIHPHSEAPPTDEEIIIERIRFCVRYVPGTDTDLSVQIETHEFRRIERSKEYVPNALDPLLVELLNTARMIVIAPDVLNLEGVIRQDISPRS